MPAEAMFCVLLGIIGRPLSQRYPESPSFLPGTSISGEISSQADAPKIASTGLAGVR
jgi:hypothetical protein